MVSVIDAATLVGLNNAMVPSGPQTNWVWIPMSNYLYACFLALEGANWATIKC